MRSLSLGLLAGVIACGCASVSLTPEGRQVSVFTAPSDVPVERRSMPDGCNKLAVVIPENWMSESELEGQAHPFSKQQNATAGGGGNALLALKRMVRPRLDFECPNAVPIRDCPGDSGAWFAMKFESYVCSADALHTLNKSK
jgi:hypothetical protein